MMRDAMAHRTSMQPQRGIAQRGTPLALASDPTSGTLISAGLPSPNEIRQRLPLCPRGENAIGRWRREIEDLVSGADSRILAIVGPCSIHDVDAALEYAEALAPLREELRDQLVILMRVYLEKPRTTVGWKGLINDPHLDGSCDVAAGLSRARSLLLRLTEFGIPAATEVLDPIAWRYTADLMSWAAIGARTAESQTHREIAAASPMPVGFKNGTDGSIQVAIHGMMAARARHSFTGIDGDGRVSVVRAPGQRSTHLILRGSHSGPNYGPEHVARAAQALREAKLPARVLVDCSHGNSGKDPELQIDVAAKVGAQLANGARDVLGVMVESHLIAGRQELCPPGGLRYGQSITDACLGLPATRTLLRDLAEACSH
jgi:3-deoxy-7-phosphoheptulonate synthase